MKKKRQIRHQFSQLNLVLITKKKEFEKIKPQMNKAKPRKIYSKQTVDDDKSIRQIVRDNTKSKQMEKNDKQQLHQLAKIIPRYGKAHRISCVKQNNSFQRKIELHGYIRFSNANLSDSPSINMQNHISPVPIYKKRFLSKQLQNKRDFKYLYFSSLSAPKNKQKFEQQLSSVVQDMAEHHQKKKRQFFKEKLKFHSQVRKIMFNSPQFLKFSSYGQSLWQMNALRNNKLFFSSKTESSTPFIKNLFGIKYLQYYTTKQEFQQNFGLRTNKDDAKTTYDNDETMVYNFDNEKSDGINYERKRRMNESLQQSSSKKKIKQQQ